MPVLAAIDGCRFFRPRRHQFRPWPACRSAGCPKTTRSWPIARYAQTSPARHAAKLWDMRIALLAYSGVQAIDVFGPAEVFTEANRTLKGVHDVQVIGTRPGPIVSASGLSFLADRTIADENVRPIDTLLVAGGPDPLAMPNLNETLSWLRNQVPNMRRYGSVCTGALILAAAGLLDGRRVTTHWRETAALQRAYPSLTVVPDAIVVRDGPVRTSAGVTAGADLALALVEEDHGPAVARAVARRLVMYLRRPGGQLQFSEGLHARPGRGRHRDVSD